MPEPETHNWVQSTHIIKGGIKTSVVHVPRAEYDNLKSLLGRHEYLYNTIKKHDRSIHLLDQCNPTFLRFEIMLDILELKKSQDITKSFRKWALIRKLDNPYIKTSFAAFDEFVKQKDIETKHGGWYRWVK